MSDPNLTDSQWDDLHSIAELAIKESGRVMGRNGEIAYAFWAGQRSQDAALAAERELRERAEKDAARLRDIGSRYLGVLDSYNTAPHEAQRAEDEFRAAIDSALQSNDPHSARAPCGHSD